MLLSVENVSRRFDAIVALDDVSFQVRPGEVFGIIGPNGAGKSTLVNLISGVVSPTSGRISFEGALISGRKPWDIAARGISRTFQIVRLYQELDVLENMLLAQHLHRRPQPFANLFRTTAVRAEKRQMLERAEELLQQLGLTGYLSQRADSLSSAEQRRLQVSMALATGAKLVMLDEPAAGLDGGEVEAFRELILGLAGTQGRTFVLIEHNVGLVMSMCDRVMVLNFGRKIAEGPPAAVRANPEVVAAYLGSRAKP
jgi:branched-chain amino acid transport system ATP-binding protein